MAAADYRWCDGCDSKAFYDANLNYDFQEHPDTGLYNVGAWIVLCRECAKTKGVSFVALNPPDPRNVRDMLLEAGYSREDAELMLGVVAPAGLLVGKSP